MGGWGGSKLSVHDITAALAVIRDDDVDLRGSATEERVFYWPGATRRVPNRTLETPECIRSAE